MKKYRGITYPSFLQYNFVRKIWKKFMCKHEIHLFDEVATIDSHCLYCDACGLTVEINSIKEEN